MSADIRRYLCFAQTYAEGRRWFREAAAGAGGRLIAADHPHAKGPQGEGLSTDIAWFGPRLADRVFVSLSGVHGQEYAFGAAAQLDWITGPGPATLPPHVAVCLIHAVNPFGAAHCSRANENFVDLNRNYFDHSRPVRSNALYAELFDLLFTPEMDEHVLDDVMTQFYAFMERSDPLAAMTAMGGGQNTHPTGTVFCGTQAEWSSTTLREIVREHLSHAERVAIVDWHTGLGDFAGLSALHEHPIESDAHRWSCAWWGPSIMKAIHNDVRPDFIGTISRGFGDDLRARGAIVADTVFEAGTVDNRSVLGGLLIDRWLRIECKDPDHPHAVRMRTLMMERLNPSLHSWRFGVLEKARGVYANTIRGLAAWR
jgi:hypothetical protein